MKITSFLKKLIYLVWTFSLFVLLSLILIAAVSIYFNNAEFALSAIRLAFLVLFVLGVTSGILGVMNSIGIDLYP